jgi:FAD/FMN-containing dehydrogenase
MAESAAPLLATLRAIVGETNVLTAEADIAPYDTDCRDRYHGRARAVVRPATTAEVAAAVRCCAEHAVPIVPQGGNTSMCGGATPHEGGHEVVISLTRMNRVRAIDADNATITVEAGMTLASVQQAAADAGLLFPLSLAAEGSCAIGGNLATNAGGTAVLRYGNARDLVLGLEVVLADGRVWNGLRGLRKDNSGYDLRQVFLGSEGTLGVITAAVLKLFPKPSTSATALAALSSVNSAVALLRLLRQALGDRLTGFELISAECVAITRREFTALPDPLPGHPWYALIQADDSPAHSPLTSQLEAALGEAIERGVATDATIARSQAQADELWAVRENIPEAQRRSGLNIKHDISLPVSSIPEFLDRSQAVLDAALPGIRYFTFGHLGDGNLHYNLGSPAGTDPKAFLAESPHVHRIVYDLVAQLGGSFSAEHGIGQLKREEMTRYKPPLEIELMKRIKDALDPQGLLNPGKVL